MNRDRRKVLASILADTAKYSLTAGVIGALIGGKISILTTLGLGAIAGVFGLLAYFVTPKDKDG
jgi:hypothetical protein